VDQTHTRIYENAIFKHEKIPEFVRKCPINQNMGINIKLLIAMENFDPKKQG